MSLLVRFARRQHQKCAVSSFNLVATSVRHYNPSSQPPPQQQSNISHGGMNKTKSGGKKKTITGAEDNSLNNITKNVKSMLTDARKNGNHDIVIQTYLRAVSHQVELQLTDYSHILHAYRKVLKTPLYNANVVMTLYATIRDKKGMTMQVFSDMLAISQHQNNYQLALEVNKDFESVNKHSESSLRLLISSLSNTNAVNQTMKFYKRYRSYMVDNTALNAKNEAAAAFRASTATEESSLIDTDSASDDRAQHSPPSAVPFTPLPSHWKPLSTSVHLDLVRMLSRQDHRLLAMETLLDFSEDNEKYLESQRAKAASKNQAAASEEGTGNENEADSLPPPSFMTLELISRYTQQTVGSSLLQLLEDGLVRYDAELVKILLSWVVDACDYHQQFLLRGGNPSYNSKISERTMYFPKGLLQRCFQLAGALGNPDITDLTKDLCALTGVSLDKEAFSQLFISYCRAKDVESVIETLVVAEASEIAFFKPPPQDKEGKDKERGVSGGGGESKRIIQRPESEVHLQGPRFIQTAISKMLGRLEESDRLYFALAELVQAEMHPPTPALNALIIAQGNLFFLDRAFAVMQDFDTVFNTKPDAHTYHALLGAVAKSRMPRVENMLQIMSDMDDNGYTPDGGCFSLLLETMMKCNDTEGASSILEHLRTSATTISTTTHNAITPATAAAAVTDTSNTGESSSEVQEVANVEVVDVSQWPSLRTLRQLAVYFTKKGETEQCQMVLQMMREKSDSKILPSFFMQRLETLAQQGVVAEEEGGCY